MALASVGASLVFATAGWNTSNTEAPKLSVGVTWTPSVPTSPLAGVPGKVRVKGSKESQAGSAAPFASVALKLSGSPRSGSAKVPAGSVNENAESSLADWSAMAVLSTGARFTKGARLAELPSANRSVAATTEPPTLLKLKF